MARVLAAAAVEELGDRDLGEPEGVVELAVGEQAAIRGDPGAVEFELGRNNSLFGGSDGGARHWAIVASLVATAKLNRVEPLAASPTCSSAKSRVGPRSPESSGCCRERLAVRQLCGLAA